MSICLSVTGLFPLAERLQGSLRLPHTAEFPSDLTLRSIPLYVDTVFSLSIYLPMKLPPSPWQFSSSL